MHTNKWSSSFGSEENHEEMPQRDDYLQCRWCGAWVLRPIVSPYCRHPPRGPATCHSWTCTCVPSTHSSPARTPPASVASSLCCRGRYVEWWVHPGFCAGQINTQLLWWGIHSRIITLITGNFTNNSHNLMCISISTQ